MSTSSYEIMLTYANNTSLKCDLIWTFRVASGK
jgi:hypothetical protein